MEKCKSIWDLESEEIDTFEKRVLMAKKYAIYLTELSVLGLRGSDEQEKAKAQELKYVDKIFSTKRSDLDKRFREEYKWSIATHKFACNYIWSHKMEMGVLARAYDRYKNNGGEYTKRYFENLDSIKPYSLIKTPHDMKKWCKCGRDDLYGCMIQSEKFFYKLSTDKHFSRIESKYDISQVKCASDKLLQVFEEKYSWFDRSKYSQIRDEWDKDKIVFLLSLLNEDMEDRNFRLLFTAAELVRSPYHEEYSKISECKEYDKELYIKEYEWFMKNPEEEIHNLFAKLYDYVEALYLRYAAYIRRSEDNLKKLHDEDLMIQYLEETDVEKNIGARFLFYTYSNPRIVSINNPNYMYSDDFIDDAAVKYVTVDKRLNHIVSMFAEYSTFVTHRHTLICRMNKIKNAAAMMSAFARATKK